MRIRYLILIVLLVVGFAFADDENADASGPPLVNDTVHTNKKDGQKQGNEKAGDKLKVITGEKEVSEKGKVIIKGKEDTGKGNKNIAGKEDTDKGKIIIEEKVKEGTGKGNVNTAGKEDIGRGKVTTDKKDTEGSEDKKTIKGKGGKGNQNKGKGGKKGGKEKDKKPKVKKKRRYHAYKNRAKTEGCEKTRCAAKNKAADYHVHPTNCSLYCACNWGKAVVMTCPKGLHFCQTSKSCRDPKLALCKIEQERIKNRKPPKKPKKPKKKKKKSKHAKQTESVTGNTTIVEQPKGPIDRRCRHEKCPTNVDLRNTQVVFSSSERCDCFCLCEDGGGVAHMFCPTNLHFNSVTKVCDNKKSANCTIPNG